jgi:ATP-binding cassette, subfamily C, bacterial LapB
MKELLRRLSLKPGLSAELILASLFANLLALAPPIFVIQVLNRYIAQGVDSTLMNRSRALVSICWQPPKPVRWIVCHPANSGKL